MTDPTDAKQARIKQFKDLFAKLYPDKKRAFRIEQCAKITMLAKSSIYVYLAPSCKVQPSERIIYLLESALKRRKMI